MRPNVLTGLLRAPQPEGREKTHGHLEKRANDQNKNAVGTWADYANFF